MMTLVNPLMDDVKRAVPNLADVKTVATAGVGFAAGKGIRVAVDQIGDYIKPSIPAQAGNVLQMGALGVTVGDLLSAAATVFGANFAASALQGRFGSQNTELAKAGAYLAAGYPVLLKLVTGVLSAAGMGSTAAMVQAKLGYFDDDLGGAWGAIAPINGPEYMRLTGLGDPSQYNTAAVGADIPVDVTPVGIWEHELAGDDMSPATIAG